MGLQNGNQNGYTETHEIGLLGLTQGDSRRHSRPMQISRELPAGCGITPGTAAKLRLREGMD
jgi:hypothetical protein